MVLKKYLKKYRLSQEEFARRLGVSQSLVSQWLSGDVTITGEWAVEIERVTHGEVPRQKSRPELYRGMAA